MISTTYDGLRYTATHIDHPTIKVSSPDSDEAVARLKDYLAAIAWLEAPHD